MKRLGIIGAVALSLAAAFGGGHWYANRAPSDPIAALGKGYGDTLKLAKGAGWRRAAEVIRVEGRTMADAIHADQEAFRLAREAEFLAKIAPELAKIVPVGTEPVDTLQRLKLADTFDRLASALDGKPVTAPDPPKPAKVVGDDSPGGPRFGWIDAPAARDKAAATLPARTLAEAAPHLVGESGAENVFLYKAWADVLGKFPSYPPQEIGDCTSFGSGHAMDLLQCIDLALTGGKPDQFRETSTEVIYGLSREIAGMLGRGDGSYGVATAKALTDVGALPREVVGPYSGARAKQFGRTGVPADLKEKAKAFKLGAATLVTRTDEADAALRNGYPFIICSSQGFTTRRDKDGVCEASGRWDHCMFVAGRRSLNGEVQYLVCQSWGDKMPTGPKTDDQPDWSFWARGPVVARILAAEDSLAFAGFKGFVARPIPERWTYSGFAKPAPKPPATARRKAA